VTETPYWLFAGALCTTRAGRKVRILVTDLPSDYPVAGWVFLDDPGAGSLESWTPTGRFYVPTKEDCEDLVGPWVEKLPELRAGMRVQLRDGTAARILCTDRIGAGPVHGLYVRPRDGKEMSQTWTRSGRVSHNDLSDRDIVKVLP
jgi:hypothetical protein